MHKFTLSSTEESEIKIKLNNLKESIHFATSLWRRCDCIHTVLDGTGPLPQTFSFPSKHATSNFSSTGPFLQPQCRLLALRNIFIFHFTQANNTFDAKSFFTSLPPFLPLSPN